jgi:hypothetical protein
VNPAQIASCFSDDFPNHFPFYTDAHVLSSAALKHPSSEDHFPQGGELLSSCWDPNQASLRNDKQSICGHAKSSVALRIWQDRLIRLGNHA